MTAQQLEQILAFINEQKIINDMQMDVNKLLKQELIDILNFTKENIHKLVQLNQVSTNGICDIIKQLDNKVEELKTKVEVTDKY